MGIAEELYDDIAYHYDTIFSDSESIEENKRITGMLDIKETDTVLDIGCGTGLLIEYKKINPSLYTGIDTSKNMLQLFSVKNPEYSDRLIQVGFENFVPTCKYDKIISLFGSITYVPPKSLKNISSILSSKGFYFLMFYDYEYIPQTYKRLGLKLVPPKTNLEYLNPPIIFKAGNFIIATNKLEYLNPPIIFKDFTIATNKEGKKL